MHTINVVYRIPPVILNTMNYDRIYPVIIVYMFYGFVVGCKGDCKGHKLNKFESNKICQFGRVEKYEYAINQILEWYSSEGKRVNTAENIAYHRYCSQNPICESSINQALVTLWIEPDCMDVATVMALTKLQTVCQTINNTCCDGTCAINYMSGQIGGMCNVTKRTAPQYVMLSLIPILFFLAVDHYQKNAASTATQLPVTRQINNDRRKLKFTNKR